MKRTRCTGHGKYVKVTTTRDELTATCNTSGLSVSTHIDAEYWQLAVSSLFPEPVAFNS
jgi:hypothetical protein